MTHSLQVYVHAARHLEDVERFGKNDPYVKATLNFRDSHSYQKTSVKSNAGNNVEWNESLTLENFNPSENHYLYVEIFDQDKGIDGPIAFTDIPLHQVQETQNHVFHGNFDLYTPDGEKKGVIGLSIAILKSGQPAHGITSAADRQGSTQIDQDHQKQIKNAERKEQLGDAATAAAVIGGLFAAKAAYDHSHHKTAHKEA
ncbi:hypothetical protein BGZ49_006333 [Haplosporangium sp. Z 27]|nr:hypothetical protein BGZ49_006333 [Haplosporangium sp. Z 27]